ncbi:squalene/phytoene synthase family protein [Cognatishimia sp. SS12]|uniref:squalene/phytoene synthase family protein n=1 Tax=Cognatishimia sp. SS12 TaxID=2979465 RepID=UPI002FEE6385
MNDDIAACAGLVERGDADRFLAVMSAPVSIREKLFPLLAFNVEVARAPWVTQESMIAEMRLQWWRDALEEIAEGRQPRRHEVVTPLAALLSPAQAQMLDESVAARRWDIYKDPFEDEADFKRYIDQTAGHLLVVATALVGGADETALRQMAYADGLARWFLAIPKLEEMQRIPLVDGRAARLAEMAAEAQRGLMQARKTLRSAGPDVAAVLRLTWQAAPLLAQVQKQPDRVAQNALGQSDFSKKFSLLWRSLQSSF